MPPLAPQAAIVAIAAPHEGEDEFIMKDSTCVSAHMIACRRLHDTVQTSKDERLPLPMASTRAGLVPLDQLAEWVASGAGSR